MANFIHWVQKYLKVQLSELSLRSLFLLGEKSAELKVDVEDNFSIYLLHNLFKNYPWGWVGGG